MKAEVTLDDPLPATIRCGLERHVPITIGTAWVHGLHLNPWINHGQPHLEGPDLVSPR
jgi:hypothetical protein